MKKSTKTLLSEYLTNLLKTTSLDDITVSEVVSGSGVSRMTFYYHFKNLNELVDWSFSKRLGESFSVLTETDSWQDGIEEIFKFFLDRRDIMLNIFHSSNGIHFDVYLENAIEPVILQDMEKRDPYKNLPSDNLNFIVRFATHAIIGFLLDWIREGMKRRPDEVIKQLANIFSVTTRYLADEISTGSLEK